MGAKGLLLCLSAVVILHCCCAKEWRKDSETQTWTSIAEIVSSFPQKILMGCGEHVVRGAVSGICTDLGSDNCQSVVNNAWQVYHYYGLGTGTYSILEDVCDNLGDLLYQGVKAVAQISWYGMKTTVWALGYVLYYSGYAVSSGGQYLLERVPH